MEPTFGNGFREYKEVEIRDGWFVKAFRDHNTIGIATKPRFMLTHCGHPMKCDCPTFTDTDL